MEFETEFSKVYLLCDCNNFFASCEKLFRPDLKHRPVAVLSNNDGVVVSRSYETKALGIAMGAPAFKIQDEIKKFQIQTFSSNFNLYLNISNRVMALLESFCKDLQIYSVDEAFLEFDNLTEQQAIDLAFKIKNAVLQQVGIHIGIGIAQTKTLAKLANHFAKQNRSTTHGVFCALKDPMRQKILLNNPIGEIWRIGKALEDKLTQDGFITAFDLSKADEKSIKKAYNINVVKTVKELNNKDCIDNVAQADNQAQIMWSRSFKDRLYDFEDLLQAVYEYTQESCSKLRAINCWAKQISVFIRTSYFGEQHKYSNIATLKLDHPSIDTRVFMSAAKILLLHIYKSGYAYNKVGVILSDFEQERAFESDLFVKAPDQKKLDKDEKLMHTLDKLNKNEKHTLIIGAQTKIKAKEQECALKKLSPSYTSAWDELPEVN